MFFLFLQATPVEDGAEAEEAGEEDTPDDPTSETGKKEQKLKNQFNFWERATQTSKNPLTVRKSSIFSTLYNDRDTVLFTIIGTPSCFA